jgi:hypothetical protein
MKEKKTIKKHHYFYRMKRMGRDGWGDEYVDGERSGLVEGEDANVAWFKLMKTCKSNYKERDVIVSFKRVE